ncbi:hypothetical protein FE243_03585 [Aliarcobacter thereius]|uniref:dynamin family protein n=1 Tax=Aliarcobacter thereius TaxID=544718 RepID=UPI0010FF5593|nr:dynamin family protein [Aliarcobacter thereius]TLT07829.1 hypothetical protein FE243_03585 [Aliarcobacter thereius]
MAKMYPSEVENFTDKNEESVYQILETLSNDYSVIYEPIIGTTKKLTPDFVILSKNFGLIVLDVKFVNLENIEKSDQRTIYKKGGDKLENFNETVKKYAFSVNNYLAKELKNNSAIIKNNKLTFPYSYGVLLFIKNHNNYTKQDISKILSLDVNSFIVCNDTEKCKENVEEFIKNLHKPFTKGINDLNANDIINSLYINSDVNETEFTNTLARFNTYLKIKELDKKQDIFKQSDLLKENILSLSEYSSKSIEFINKNLPYGLDQLLDKLKEKKDEIENEKFRIGIFGYFSTGKSTFLNAILGIDFLPSAEERLTAIFTKLVHINQSKDLKDGDIEVYFKNSYELKELYNESILNLKEALEQDEHNKFYDNFDKLEDLREELGNKLDSIKTRDYSGDIRERIKNSKIILKTIMDCDNSLIGSIEKIKIENLKDYVTDDKKAILLNEVIIYLDNPFLEKVEIVDTPGYGSTNSLDTKKAHEFVKEANIVIFLTKATTPMQDINEKDFLEEYIKIYKDNDNTVNSSNLFIVANQIDTTQKSVEEVKEMILKNIYDEFEGDFKIDKKNIFTISSKYHLDLQSNKEIEKPRNANSKDLENFKNSFQIYLKESKDREFIQQNFSKIDDILTETKKSFEKEEEKLHSDINSINKNINHFEKNKKYIETKLDMYIDSISNIEAKLQKVVTSYLDSLIITLTENNDKNNAKSELSKDFESWCEKYKKRPSNDTVYDYFHSYIDSITSSASPVINEKYNNLIEEKLKTVNTDLEKYTKELELEYNITGLSTYFVLSDIAYKELSNVDLNKSFFRDIFEFIKRLFVDDRYLSYAESMVDSWNNNPNVYILVQAHLNKQIKYKFDLLKKEFETTKDDLLKKIESKLNNEKKYFELKQKDKNLFETKSNKFKEVLEKIDKNKQKINQQIEQLFKGNAK